MLFDVVVARENANENMPATRPPTCAQNAMPSPASPSAPSDTTPLRSCRSAQESIMVHAGTTTEVR